MVPSSPISQQLVQPVLIHGILALDSSKMSNKTVVKNNVELVGVMALSSPISQQLVQPVFIHGILALDLSKVTNRRALASGCVLTANNYFCTA